MNITVIGTGYVGLVTGACLADVGHTVTCVDNDSGKIDKLNAGEIPFYEPGLGVVVKRNLRNRLTFTTELVLNDIIFVCVGTPSLYDGNVDLSQLWRVLTSIKGVARVPQLVVIKSTVPPGTNAEAARRLGGAHVVVSNPEFLREGTAVSDFMYPDRIVIGAANKRDAKSLVHLYDFVKDFSPIVCMGLEDAELTKYVANGFLAMKISFINEVANICESVGANIDNVRTGIGQDKRIGFDFLNPGLGYGGSCFPKDVRGLQHIANETIGGSPLLQSVDEINSLRPLRIREKVRVALGGAYDLRGRTIAILGGAFKPRTDDIRESQGLAVAGGLVHNGADVQLYDPRAMANIKSSFSKLPGIQLEGCAMDAVSGADALVIVTEWGEFNQLPWGGVRATMKTPIIVDGRNMLDAEAMRSKGFTYYGVGR